MADANDISERLLTDAGIVPGMRVIDIGCGNGEVSLLLARLVGGTGQVVGLDRDAESLAAARQRANHDEIDNLTFLQSDLSTPETSLVAFDAIA